MARERAEWVAWLMNYSAAAFYDAFLHNAQGAQSECIHCHNTIYLDIVEGGGVPDWKTEDGDYGCGDSTETTITGTGSHMPKRLRGEGGDIGAAN
jgi:hypothetical protein